MKANDVFPSNFLKAADIQGHEPIVTIDRVEMQEVGDGNKPVVYFKGKERGIVLNKTNFAAIEDITGEPDTDQWAGHKVKLYVAKVEYQGKRVPAIRIDNAGPTRTAPAPVPVDAPTDEEIPF